MRLMFGIDHVSTRCAPMVQLVCHRPAWGDLVSFSTSTTVRFRSWKTLKPDVAQKSTSHDPVAGIGILRKCPGGHMGSSVWTKKPSREARGGAGGSTCSLGRGVEPPGCTCDICSEEVNGDNILPRSRVCGVFEYALTLTQSDPTTISVALRRSVRYT